MKKIRNFDIQHKLGSGSYGVIYKVLNKTTKQICVLKQISLGRLSEKARKSAINEATIMGKLVHPFIVRYRQSFIEDNTLNIVMEYCDNGDLNQFLKMQNKRPLKQDKIWKIFISICFGLQYIHKNKILHRDIKSLNIFMNKNEDVKIGDLGVAKMLTSNEFAQTMVGTPFYLSPQLCEQKPYNQKSDIWALGCLLYELCTFRHPFQAQNQGSLILKIIRGKYAPIPELYSKDLKEVIDLCLERDYKRRPTTSNLLSRPKILLKIQDLKINTLIEDEMKKITKQKQNYVVTPKVVTQQKPASVKQYKLVKALDIDSRKVIKAVDNEPKNEVIKKQVIKQQPKKQDIKKQEPISKREPVIILPKPIIHSQRKADAIDAKKINQVKAPQQNKNDFINNLQKMIDAEEKEKKESRKSSHVYTQSPIRASDVKKNDRIQKVAEKVEDIKGNKEKNIELVKSPSMNEPKRQTPSISYKKSSNSHQSNIVKKQEAPKIPIMPSKPPIAPSSQISHKEPNVMKVKNEKVIQPKVFESHKNLNKPSGIIKSGGFSSNIEVDRSQKEKNISNSRDKLTSAKRSSIPNIKVEKEKQTPKQLFGPSSQTPTPSVQHKSEKMIKNSGYAALYQDRRKQQMNKNSRVRRGGRNEVARNAKNPTQYNQISKQEQAEVMNLPNNIKSNGPESSDSEEDSYIKKQSHVIEDLKRRSNQNKFKLKEINHDLVLQKYEDMLKSAEQQTEREEDRLNSDDDQLNEEVQKQIKEAMENEKQDAVMSDEQAIVEDLQLNGRKNSRNSNDPIEEQLQTELFQEDYMRQKQQERQGQEEQDMFDSERRDEWSFDEEPELPMMEEKQSPFFEPHNPYLIEEQEETTQNKINYLQTKLQQNMKREDEINKLMQIKLEECRKYVGNQKTLSQILVFFRNKLHMQDDFNESDEKEVQNFLAKKGLTDHYKFQNIYKIMHFEMQLENTRKIIQRICKRLSDFEESS